MPYRADNVGSLLRPPELLQASAAHDQGRITLEQLRQIEDKAILQALELQRQVGLDVFTDGEYRRVEFRSVFDQGVEGLLEDPTPARPGPGPGTVRPRMVIGDRVRQVRRMTAHESSFLHRHAAAHFKITLPAVSQIVSSYWQRGVSEHAYPSVAALYLEIIGIVRREIEALVAAGVSYIQLDAPRYTYFVDERWRQRFRDQGEDPDAVIEEWITADNASLAGISPQGTTRQPGSSGARKALDCLMPLSENHLRRVRTDRSNRMGSSSAACTRPCKPPERQTAPRPSTQMISPLMAVVCVSGQDQLA